MSYSSWQKKKILLSKEYQEKIYKELNNQNYVRRRNKQIILDDNKEYTEFVSCSYLGLDQHNQIVNGAATNISEIGLSFLSARTRIKYKGLEIFEDILNEIFKAKTVIFSTTHLAHLGLIPLIASGEMPSVKLSKNGCFFLLDNQVHASIQINIGLMQQFGPVEKLDFNNLTLLTEKLEKVKAQLLTPILFCDSIGSMGGVLPLQELLTLTNNYQGYLYLDDAHGMSIYGKNGNGYVISTFKSLPKRVILTTSLGKGFGTCGGVIVLPTNEDVDFVKTYSSTYMFSGTLINPLINACIESGKIHLSPEINELQKKMLNNIFLFDKLINNKSKIINFGLNTPIRGIMIGNEFLAIEKGFFLKQQGYLTVVATYPIREHGSAIIRALICANHTNSEIEGICKTINLLL